MKITKYEHSCLDIEQDGKRLLIDPGVVTTSIPDYNDIAAVLVTHMHADHLDKEKLLAIHAQNPDSPIYTVQAVADELKDSLPLIIVTAEQVITAGPFQLEFTGGQHAVIHASVPITDNVGVTVNGKLYYPGDSFSVPNIPVDILAIPISAPWLKVAEAMDFITALKPRIAFPVHDALLSDFGRSVSGNWLQRACDSINAEYIVLQPGQSLSR